MNIEKLSECTKKDASELLLPSVGPAKQSLAGFVRES